MGVILQNGGVRHGGLLIEAEMLSYKHPPDSSHRLASTLLNMFIGGVICIRFSSYLMRFDLFQEEE